MAKALEGTIVAYAISDGIGRIELDDGEELRFSLRSLKGLVPAIGVRVVVGATEPYPLGGRRALDVTLADDRGYDKLKKQFQKAQGEAMRRDLGRRADEFEMPVTALKKALIQGPATTVPATSSPARPRGHSLRRAPTPPPMPRGSRASTARPTTSSRASTSRPVRTVRTVKRKGTRSDTR